MRVMGIEELLGGGEREPEPPKLLKQPMQARVLLDLLPVIQRKNPFKAGDLVVAAKERKFMHLDPSMVYLVTMVFDADLVANARADKTTPRDDMLVVAMLPCRHGDAHWREVAMESWRFEKYAGGIEPGA